MAEHQCWIVAELRGGDPDAVLDALLAEDGPFREGQALGNTLVLFGGQTSMPRDELREVSEAISRLVFVASIEGGEGETRSEYYADVEDLSEPTEELHSTPGRWWASEHFDYYASRYDVHAAV